MRISIIDYGSGNLRSVLKAFQFCGASAEIARKPSDIEHDNALVIPGVGSFADAMKNIKKSGFDELIRAWHEDRKPVLGICLGLQMLFEWSEEGDCEGLGIFKGKVKKLSISEKVPHMGWNDIRINRNSRSGFLGSEFEGNYFYFVHSYAANPENQDEILCFTDYGNPFASGVGRENVLAFQFHPEKSSKQGLAIIRKFFNHASRFYGNDNVEYSSETNKKNPCL